MNIRPISLLAVVAAAGCLALSACSSSSSTSSAPAASSTSSATASAVASTASASASASTAASASATASGSDSNVPAGLTGAAKTVAENWVTFMDGTTPVAKRVSLLQNGSTFSAVLSGQGSSTQGKQTSAQVTAVAVAGSKATVTWNLLLSNIPILKAQKGQAILAKGVWQVSDTSFCGLLAMQPPVPGACKA